MNSSFYNGITGVKTHQFGLDIWANNIANINKVGFRNSIPEFSTIYSQVMTQQPTTPTANDIGIGSRISATTTQFTQGSITQTENKFDLALNGDGWFGVTSQNGEQFFTRAGIFNKDAAGYLVDSSGNFLLGTAANNIQNGIVVPNPTQNITLSNPANQTKIQLDDNLMMPAIPTTQVDFKGALNSKPIYQFNTNKERIEIPNKENFQSTLINPDGTQHKLVLNFTKVIPQQVDKTVWNATAIIYDINDNPISTQEGQLKFNDRGALISNTLSTIDNNGVSIALNFGSIYNPNIPNSGFDGLFAYHGDKELTKIVSQNGKKSGKLQDYSIQSDGTIIAAFTNGASIPISKVAVYHFQNNAGLQQTTPLYFKQTANSGEPLFYKDANGNTINTSTISSFALEQSNVSMTTALTELLVMQKAFDANAKSITTSDQMIQNAINMKK